MKNGDCFLMKGSSIDEPMTLYHIVDMKEDKLWAWGHIGSHLVIALCHNVL